MKSSSFQGRLKPGLASIPSCSHVSHADKGSGAAIALGTNRRLSNVLVAAA